MYKKLPNNATCSRGNMCKCAWSLTLWKCHEKAIPPDMDMLNIVYLLNLTFPISRMFFPKIWHLPQQHIWLSLISLLALLSNTRMQLNFLVAFDFLIITFDLENLWILSTVGRITNHLTFDEPKFLADDFTELHQPIHLWWMCFNIFHNRHYFKIHKKHIKTNQSAFMDNVRWTAKFD